MSQIQVSINSQIFPLSTIKQALYVLSDRIDGRLDGEANGKIDVTLVPLAEEIAPEEMEQALNRALIAVGANEHAFQMAAPIRNYLAQSAFSITSQNQQTIQEFIAGVAGKQNEEHAGAPTSHVDAPSPESDPFAPTESGNKRLIDADKGLVVLHINTDQYLLPDVLWAAHEIRDLGDCTVSYLTNNRLVVQLKPCQDNADLESLGATFERWLKIAVERQP